MFLVLALTLAVIIVMMVHEPEVDHCNGKRRGEARTVRKCARKKSKFE